MTQLICATTIGRTAGEFHVRAYGYRGERLPEADYFTPDRDDAKQTANAMLKPFRLQEQRKAQQQRKANP